jgi:hypothetical protein
MSSFGHLMTAAHTNKAKLKINFSAPLCQVFDVFIPPPPFQRAARRG